MCFFISTFLSTVQFSKTSFPCRHLSATTFISYHFVIPHVKHFFSTFSFEAAALNIEGIDYYSFFFRNMQDLILKSILISNFAKSNTYVKLFNKNTLYIIVELF